MNSYERRCRLLTRAYPPRFRESRGEELLSTLLDLQEPGQIRPSLRESLDVIRGGLAARLQDRPPFWRWLLYRTFFVRLPLKYRMWARDDIQGRFYIFRRYFGPLGTIAYAAGLFIVIFFDEEPFRALGITLGLGVGYLIRRIGAQRVRRRELARYDLDPNGSPIRPRPSEDRSR
ncbi:hypothetical protein SAMN05216276_111312 [Streptosporangium subroseum]|uniref:Uncharacterized protein n=1 Tax=Streptosporangium subroseum TaxID=106412 RepID=A0A239PBG4_9ACTN|nr:hypothetical protein [Streptosporangium subroseum]SNT64223.1 hypothetical protein SAMN05216276_111312 [Streptosporangium subroseum]